VNLIVVDPGVVADAFEAGGNAARLLTLLAYGSTARALHQLTCPEELTDQYPAARLRGPSFAPLASETADRWELLNARLENQPSDWGLATSGAVLREMRHELERNRPRTRLVPLHAWHLAVQLASATTSDEDLAALRRQVAPETPRSTLIALAVGAEHVVLRDGAPTDRRRRRWPHLRLAHPPGDESNEFSHDGHTVRHYTMFEFSRLHVIPRFSDLPASMDLLASAYLSAEEPLRA
jgi:hypothetical protein